MSNEPNSADLARAPVRARRIVITVVQITMLALTSYSAHGDVSVAGPAGSMFSLRGFGTAGVVHSSEDEADFTGSQLQANGAGHTRQWSPTVDGKAGVDAPGGGRFDVNRGWLVGDSLKFGAATVHASYEGSIDSVNVNGPNALFGALEQFGPEGIALTDRYYVDHKLVRDFTVGAEYNPANWFVMGEWGKRDSTTWLGRTTAWYASGGYRVADFTPYVTYAEVVADSNRSDPGLNVAAFSAYLAGTVTSLNAGLNAVLASLAVQNTISAGTRWDFMKDVDVKVQYDHTRLGAGGRGGGGVVQERHHEPEPGAGGGHFLAQDESISRCSTRRAGRPGG